MMKKIFCYSVIMSLWLFSFACQAQEVGDALPTWQKGYLDIHHINTGCGNCAYVIFPDGTTMLIDAGENSAKADRHVPPKPNENKAPGEWIVD